MHSNVERLLRLVADYHNFCEGNNAGEEMKDQDELFADELDFVAAAAGISVQNPDHDVQLK